MWICQNCINTHFKDYFGPRISIFKKYKCGRCGFVSNNCQEINDEVCKRVFKNQPMKEERTLKMSLETAKKLYKQCIDNPALSNEVYKNWLLQNFTKEELEGNKRYTWEESYAPGGYYICSDPCNLSVKRVINMGKHNHFKSVYKTEKQALSALAFAQLSHICVKYNSNVERNISTNEYWMITAYNGSDLGINSYTKNTFQLGFYRWEDAKTSMETNTTLWKQFWML